MKTNIASAESYYERVQDDIANGIRWDQFADCREQPELFAPPAGPEYAGRMKLRVDAAKTICRSCVVRQNCLEDALDEPIDRLDPTIRAGFEAYELNRLRRKYKAS